MTKYEVIPEEIQKDYLRRLNTPYEKKGLSKKFFDQFEKASGQEIKDGKFWRIISSSRLCFDLYSWMADDDSYVDVEVEKQLTGLNAGGSPPNMDVFFETASDIFFIESKYTELVRGKFKIPEAYWVETDAYHNTKGELTEKPILERYRGRRDVKEKFVSFIEYVRKIEENRKGPTWFDSKQEICHFLGIVFYLLENKPQKSVHFLNVAANFSCNDVAVAFCIRAEEMIQQILIANSISTPFDYQLCSIKDFFGSFLLLDRKGYKTSKTVRELISDPGLYDISKNPIL